MVQVTIQKDTTVIQNNFYSNKSITSVTIPDSVTTIGEGAFSNNNLTSVTIPSTVKDISDNAFTSNENLKIIYFTFFSDVNMGSNVFDSTLSTTCIIYNFKDIDDTYYNSIKVTKSPFTFEDNYKTITDYNPNIHNKYDYLHGLSGKVIIPNGITTIGAYAFANYQLTSVIIPDSVTTINEFAFYGNNKLMSVIIPDSVSFIGDYAFAYIPLCEVPHEVIDSKRVKKKQFKRTVQSWVYISKYRTVWGRTFSLSEAKKYKFINKQTKSGFNFSPNI